MWCEYNPNPNGLHTGDCVVRALTKALDCDWDNAYTDLAVQGFMLSDMPSANYVWGSLLRDRGFARYGIPNSCPDCYTIQDFCEDNPKGLFVVATGTHAVAVVDGNYYDTWDCGKEVPVYYFYKEG